MLTGNNDLVDTTVDVDEYNTPRLLILISVLPIYPTHNTSTYILFSDTSQPDVRDRLNSPLLVTHATHAPPLSWRQSCEVQFSISLNLSAFLCFG